MQEVGSVHEENSQAAVAGQECTEYYDSDIQVQQKYREIGQQGLYEREREIVERHFTNRDGRVLDLGCGTGRTTQPLAELGFDVIGVDLSESMISNARDIHPDQTFQVGDATNLDFPSESFDYILFAGRGLDDIRPAEARMRALHEIRRVLKPGGRFAFDANNIVNRFLVDPTSLADWKELGRFVRRNSPRFWSRHAEVAFDHGIDLVHAIAPRSQCRQLTDIGFSIEEIRTSSSGVRPIHLDPRPYYVAKK